MMSTPNGPPGWYPDPQQPDTRRWWDGVSWAPQEPQAPAEQPKRTITVPLWLLACIGAIVLSVILLVVVVVVTAGGKDDPDNAGSSQSEVEEELGITGTSDDWKEAACAPGTLRQGTRDSLDQKAFLQSAVEGQRCSDKSVIGAPIHIGLYNSQADIDTDIGCHFFRTWTQVGLENGQYMLFGSFNGYGSERSSLDPLQQFGFTLNEDPDNLADDDTPDYCYLNN